MHIPSPLTPGKTIGVVTPARKIDNEILQQGIKTMEAWGVKVELGKHVLGNQNTYLAATDGERLNDLQSMLDRPDIEAIMCARGGYGTTRILDYLDFNEFIKQPKWIVGFSDITALHLKVHSLGIESIHGLMPGQFCKPAYETSMNAVKSILFGANQFSLQGAIHPLNRIGKAKGKVIGGNLSLVVDALGTKTSPDTAGKILMLEEIDEPLYKLDRMLTQLKRADKMSNLSGLIVGHMTGLTDTTLPFGQSIEEIIRDKVESYSYPVAFGFPFGHEAPNLAWRHGAKGQLNVTDQQAALQFN